MAQFMADRDKYQHALVSWQKTATFQKKVNKIDLMSMESGAGGAYRALSRRSRAVPSLNRFRPS